MIRSCLPILFCLLTWPVHAEDSDADIILLKNGHTLTGSLLTVPSETMTTVKVATASGTIELHKEMIDSMKIGYSSRLRMLDPNSYAAHMELARWCLAEGMKREALALIRKALTLGAGDAEAIGLMAILIDEIERSPEGALPLYQRYRDELGGQDQRILERLAELEQAEEAYQNSLAEVMAQAAKVQTAEGMETDIWLNESPKFYNPVDHAVVTNTTNDSLTTNQVLRLSLKAGDKYKGAIRHRLTLDAKKYSKLVFYVVNDNQSAIPISIAVKSGDQWEYFESRTQMVPTGGQTPQRLEFDLLAKSYKCVRDDYAGYNWTIDNPADVREIQLQFHNANREMVLTIDGIGFAGVKP